MHSLHSLLLCDMQLMWVHVVPFLQACVCLWYLWQFLYRTTRCSSGSSLSSMHETYVSLTLATRCQTGICCGYFQLMRANKLETAVSKPAVLGCQFFAFYFLITTAFVQCLPLQLETYLCEVGRERSERGRGLQLFVPHSKLALDEVTHKCYLKNDT